MDLRSWRKSQKLTQVAAGELLGISQSSLTRIERGDQWPDAATIAAIEAKTAGAVTASDIVAICNKAKAA